VYGVKQKVKKQELTVDMYKKWTRLHI
jgi:hypothetical protein